MSSTPARDPFRGTGDMPSLMRAHDWSATPLGPIDAWPESLQSSLSICVGSRFPIAIYWGERLALLYNDAWSPILGSKHPSALGLPAIEVWPEIWDTIGPLFQQVMTTGEATFAQNSLLAMHRHGYTEECYFDYTFTPIRGLAGTPEGVFNAVIETTYRVISDRRTKLLGLLAEKVSAARSTEAVCEEAAAALEHASHDVAFAAIYVLDGASAARVATVAIPPEAPAASPTIVLGAGDDEAMWQLGRVRDLRAPRVVESIGRAFSGDAPGGAWPEPATSAIVAPLTTATGHVVGFVVVGASPRRGVDVDYVRFVEQVAGVVSSGIVAARAFEEERRRAEQLADLDRAKTTFFSNVSHELRTPLTLILAPIEEALRADAGALSGAELEVVHRNAVRLLKLVNTLLDFSRLEAGRADASFVETDLAALTRDLASAFESAVRAAGLRFEVDCPPLDAPAFVDRDGWEKVVLNLLSNALKFTHEGGITVRLRSKDGVAELAISDTGTGIPPAELDRVFDRFHRVAGTRSRSHEGSGIGLALVAEIVRLHGGDVTVASDMGRGTTFDVRIPLGKEHLASERLGSAAASPTASTVASPYVQEALRWSSEDLAGAGTAPEAADADRARVLVADDNADMRDYLRKLLSARWRVDVAADGAQALEMARRAAPDLVVTDVMMPNLDGFGLLAALRADPSLAHVPVVVLSARAGEDARVEGLEVGADDYLAKPFSGRELVARVAARLEVARARAATLAERDKADRARADAEEANRAKDDFLAMLGHELRNPLSPILTALHLVRLRGSQGIAREVDVIERQAQHLVRLVDDLLDVSRFARGKVTLAKESVEIADVIASAIETASPMIENARHQLFTSVPRVGLVVDVDRVRMAQVFANLLTNAAKYTPPHGRIAISARREGAGREGAAVVVEVEDSGVGISPELLPNVFDLFVQARQTIARSQGGLGLGLTIVKSLVALHGGSVSAASAGVGMGSRFTVRLPALDARPAPTTDRESPPPENVNARHERVLIVDDNVDAADMLADAMRLLGYRTAVANDAIDALEQADAFKPHIALLDIGLPVMDGYELAQRFRASFGGEMLLVAITGYGQESDRARSSDAGFHAHLTKPVDLERLAKVLERARR